NANWKDKKIKMDNVWLQNDKDLEQQSHGISLGQSSLQSQLQLQSHLQPQSSFTIIHVVERECVTKANIGTQAEIETDKGTADNVVKHRTTASRMDEAEAVKHKNGHRYRMYKESMVSTSSTRSRSRSRSKSRNGNGKHSRKVKAEVKVDIPITVIMASTFKTLICTSAFAFAFAVRGVGETCASIIAKEKKIEQRVNGSLESWRYFTKLPMLRSTFLFLRKNKTTKKIVQCEQMW
ncbi:hypothetical protein RFI_04043, partial [Reticulomyxa filosa]